MEPWGPTNPFPGLRPFEPEDDLLFFGREKETDDLLRRLRSTRFLCVVGTSGSGKSSLVRCGLIPSLQSGFMVTAGSTWRIAKFRPGEDPIGQLAQALDSTDVLASEGELAATNRVLLEATLRRGTRGLIETVRQARIPSQDNVLVIVDQFEELFRFRQSRRLENSRDEALSFVKLLLESAEQDSVPIYIVLTMRSDFIGECMEYPGLPQAINAGLYLVPRMTRDQLRSAITGPIAVARGQIAPPLVTRLLNDVGDDPDQLPVLQHALMRTWQFWQLSHVSDEPIDIREYEAVGTLKHALSLHADEAYEEANCEHVLHVVERLFKAITDTFSDPRGVRRPTSVQELAAICQVSEQELINVVEIFRGKGRNFLMPPANVPLESRSIIDLSHESLMRNWTRLITWAEEERSSADFYVRLSRAAGWFEEGTAGLWHNPELEFALQWKDRNQPTQAWGDRYAPFARAVNFLDRSEAERNRVENERERERRRKLRQTQWATAVLGALLIAALSLAYIAWAQKGRAEANLSLAKSAVDESLSSAGRQQAREAADVPEMEQFRKELLEKAKNFYAIFTKEKPNNEKLLAEASLAHSRLGDIDRLLGLHQDAVSEYQQAIDHLDQLAHKYAAKPDYRQALGYAHNWLGETLRLWLEETQESVPYTRADARKQYDAALQLQNELYAQYPANSLYQQELARTYYNRGILSYDDGSTEQSESDFRHAASLLEPLVKDDTSASSTQKQTPPAQELARVYNNIGTLLKHEERLDEGREFYERAITLDEKLTNAQPGNREYKEELANYYENLAILLLQENRITLAEKRNHQALDLIEELASPSQSVELARAKAHLLRGEILESQTVREARTESQQTQQILQKLQKAQGSRAHPEFHVMYMHLGEDYVELADKSLKSGSINDAEKALNSLANLLPELAGPDRTRLTKSYDDLTKKLRERRARHN